MNEKRDDLLENGKAAARTSAVAPRPRAATLTRAGLSKLEAELRQAEEARLPELAERIRVIRQMAADLSESGEYYGALDDLSQLQARIAELRFAIGAGEVTEEGPVATGHVHLGSIVTLAMNGERETYQVVGSVESDPLAGRISEESPLGRALLGHIAGERVQWRSPGGVNAARIQSVA